MRFLEAHKVIEGVLSATTEKRPDPEALGGEKAAEGKMTREETKDKIHKV